MYRKIHFLKHPGEFLGSKIFLLDQQPVWTVWTPRILRLLFKNYSTVVILRPYKCGPIILRQAGQCRVRLFIISKPDQKCLLWNLWLVCMVYITYIQLNSCSFSCILKITWGNMYSEILKAKLKKILRRIILRKYIPSTGANPDKKNFFLLYLLE